MKKSGKGETEETEETDETNEDEDLTVKNFREYETTSVSRSAREGDSSDD